MSSLVASQAKVGLITYTNGNGTITTFSARHIVSRVSLPGNKISIVTTGGGQILKFDNATEKNAAIVVLDDALSGDLV